MPEFVAEPIREFDGDGRIIGAGLAWNEMRTWLYQLSGFGVSIAIIMIIIGVTVGPVGGIDLLLVEPAIILLVLCCGLPSIYGRRARVVVFEGGNRMATPNGSPGYRKRTFVGGHWSWIRSIERVQFSQTVWLVHIYFSGGEIVCLAHPTAISEAHKIVVQLTRALDEIRKAEHQTTDQKGRLID